MMKDVEYCILMPDGQELEPAGFAFGPNDQDFAAMVRKEALGIEAPASGEPEYLKVMSKFGIAWERMSDCGHMRYAPPGALIFDLVGDYAVQAARDQQLPVMMVKGTNLFSLDEPAVAEHAVLYGDRLYKLGEPDSGREFILRYAACHQQFAMVRDWGLSYRQLPFGMLEVADSYRLEQSGECMLSFRVRRLNMPDLHVFCRGEEEARERFAALHRSIMDDVRAAGREYEMLVNFPDQAAYERSKPFVRSLLLYRNRPALLHFYPGDKDFYWTINIEYHIVDALGRAREIATVQMDTGNAARFDIHYVAADASHKRPVILHTAITGSIERYIYMLVDTAIQQGRAGRPPALPFWLAPEQLRIIAVASEHVEGACALARRLACAGLRAGVDDRDETVARKVRQAGQDWVGAHLVFGDNELAGAPLSVHWRHLGENRVMSPDDLAAFAAAESAGKPFRPLYYPERMSQRPVFH